MDLAALRTWIEAMAEPERRRLLLSNLLHDIREGLIEVSVVRKIVTATAEKWIPASGARPDLLIQKMADGSPHDYLCQGSPVSADGVRCSRIVDEQTFVKRHLDPSRAGLIEREELPPEVLSDLVDGYLNDALIGDIRGGRPFAWVTRSEYIDEVRAGTTKKQELASRLRTLFGLQHFNEDQILLEVVYPESSVPRLARPTFIEGGASLVYRSTRASDDWGRTVDLETIGVGAPEAVHLPIQMTGEFKVKRIGRIKSSPPRLDWSAVVKSCKHEWDGTTELVLQALEE